jgi:hypothetical protein
MQTVVHFLRAFIRFRPTANCKYHVRDCVLAAGKWAKASDCIDNSIVIEKYPDPGKA